MLAVYGFLAGLALGMGRAYWLAGQPWISTAVYRATLLRVWQWRVK